jgi:hypothetical protein
MTLNPVRYPISEICEARYAVLVNAISNPKLEARSTKQTPMFQIQMDQTGIPVSHDGPVRNRHPGENRGPGVL